MPLLLLSLLPSFGPRYPTESLLPSLPSSSQPNRQLQYLCSVTQPVFPPPARCFGKCQEFGCSSLLPIHSVRELHHPWTGEVSTEHPQDGLRETTPCIILHLQTRGVTAPSQSPSPRRWPWWLPQAPPREPSISNATSHKVRSSPSACVEAALQMKVAASLNSLKTEGLSHFHSLMLRHPRWNHKEPTLANNTSSRPFPILVRNSSHQLKHRSSGNFGCTMSAPTPVFACNVTFSRKDVNQEQGQHGRTSGPT